MNIAQNLLPLYLLAGGHSSRFGSDKALALLHHTPLILHAQKQFAPYISSTTVVADTPNKYADLNLRTIPDLHSHQGPIGGLLAALTDSPTDWLLLAACDALLNPLLIPKLFTTPRIEIQAIAFKQVNWQPLPALFHKSALINLKIYISSNRTSLWQFLESLPHHSIAVPVSTPFAAQINTPDDLLKLSGERS